MKKTNNSRNTTLMLALAAVVGAGVFTTAIASPRTTRGSGASAFKPGAAEYKAAQLPLDWRYEKKAVTFDNMYAR